METALSIHCKSWGFRMCFPWGLIIIICLLLLVPFVGCNVRDGLVPTYTICGIVIYLLTHGATIHLKSMVTLPQIYMSMLTQNVDSPVT